jgi:hypothetical protein
VKVALLACQQCSGERTTLARSTQGECPHPNRALLNNLAAPPDLIIFPNPLFKPLYVMNMVDSLEAAIRKIRSVGDQYCETAGAILNAWPNGTGVTARLSGPCRSAYYQGFEDILEKRYGKSQ